MGEHGEKLVFLAIGFAQGLFRLAKGRDIDADADSSLHRSLDRRAPAWQHEHVDRRAVAALDSSMSPSTSIAASGPLHRKLVDWHLPILLEDSIGYLLGVRARLRDIFAIGHSEHLGQRRFDVIVLHSGSLATLMPTGAVSRIVLQLLEPLL